MLARALLAFSTEIARTEPSVTDRLIKATPASAFSKNQGVFGGHIK